MTRGRIEVISIFAISLIILVAFSLSAVSALPTYQTCNNGQGVLVYLNPEITGCDVDCNTCGERTVTPCSGSPVLKYNECSTSSWNCGKLKVGTNSCVGASEDKFLDLPAGSSSTFLTPLINEGYYYTYGSCNDATYVSAWDSNFRKCVEIFNENGQVKARYHGFFLGDGCSGDDEIVSLSSTEFNKQSSKRYYCGGYCQPDYTFYCSNPGVSKTEIGCQEPREVCYDGFDVINPESRRGICTNDGRCEKIDLSVNYIKPIQVLEGFEWIKNKEGMVRVKINLENPLAPPDVENVGDPGNPETPPGLLPIHDKYTENVKIKLILWKYESKPLGAEWVYQWEKTATKDIARPASYSGVEIKEGKDTINFFNIKFSEVGSYKFEVIVDPDKQIEEIYENNNDQNSSSFAIKETEVKNRADGKLVIIYFPVEVGAWKNGANKGAFENLVKRQHQFVQDVFPLPKEKVEKQIDYELAKKFKGETQPLGNYIYTYRLLKRLAAMADVMNSNSLNIEYRIVGIIPQEILGAGESETGTQGLSITGRPAALVSNNARDGITAHELMHTYGDGAEEYNDNPEMGNVIQEVGWNERKGEQGAIINLDTDRERNDEANFGKYDFFKGQRTGLFRWFCMRGLPYRLYEWIDNEHYWRLKYIFIGGN